MITLILAAVIVGISSFLFFRNRRGADEPPLAHYGAPVIGTVREYQSNPHRLFASFRKKYGNLFVIDLLMMKVTMMCGENARDVFFNLPDEEMSFSAAYEPILHKMLGDPPIIDVTKTGSWVTAPTIRKMNLRSKLEKQQVLMRSEALQVFEEWTKQEHVNILRAAGDLVVRVNCGCFVGRKFMEEKSQDICKIYFDFEMVSNSPGNMGFSSWLPIHPTVQKARAYRKALNEIFTTEALRQIRDPAAREDGAAIVEMIDMVQNIETYAGYTEFQQAEKISNWIIGFMFGAHTNTAGSIGWSLAFLATHPKLHKELIEEQKSVAAQKLEPMDSFREMKLLGYVPKEVARLTAPPLFLRRAMVDVKFEGRTIKSGTLVGVTPALDHLDPMLFPDPNKFDPDRFLSGKSNESKLVYFGFGRHRCLGEPFANAVVSTSLASFLQEYDITYIPSAKLTEEGRSAWWVEAAPEFPEPTWDKCIGIPLETRGDFNFKIRKRAK